MIRRVESVDKGRSAGGIERNVKSVWRFGATVYACQLISFIASGGERRESWVVSLVAWVARLVAWGLRLKA